MVLHNKRVMLCTEQIWLRQVPAAHGRAQLCLWLTAQHLCAGLREAFAAHQCCSPVACLSPALRCCAIGQLQTCLYAQAASSLAWVLPQGHSSTALQWDSWCLHRGSCAVPV